MGPKVLVIGGGVAGLTAAHELAERGFEVTLFEASKKVGGLATSEYVEGLPTEHGFHFFPSFYRHLPDTMRRIPTDGAVFPRQSVADQLVPGSRIAFARERASELPFDLTVRSMEDIVGLTKSLAQLGLTAAEISLFVSKLLALVRAVASGDEDALDDVTWWDFIEAGRQSERYQRYFGDVAVRWTVAMDPRRASARTIGRIALQFWKHTVVPGADGANTAGTVGRVLNNPAHEAWFDPWYAHLQTLDVNVLTRVRVRRLHCDRQRVTHVEVELNGETGEFGDFEYCVAALPIEGLCAVLDQSPELISSDPMFRRIRALRRSLDWMVGLQFYLSKDVPVTPGGIMLQDSPWALTATSQVQFWKHKRFQWRGGPAANPIRQPDWLSPRPERAPVRGVISVIISNWDDRGDFQDLTAKACTPKELGYEVWSELKAHLNERPKNNTAEREPLLKDEDLVAWHMSLPEPNKRWQNDNKLFINTVGSRRDRPTATTEVRNFFLAGDYIRTNTDLACMESANEAGRLAVNGILDASQSSHPQCEIWPLEFEIADVGVASARRAFEALNQGSKLLLREATSFWDTFRRSRG